MAMMRPNHTNNAGPDSAIKHEQVCYRWLCCIDGGQAHKN